jgi:hypothetical protein
MHGWQGSELDPTDGTEARGDGQEHGGGPLVVGEEPVAVPATGQAGRVQVLGGDRGVELAQRALEPGPDVA